MRLATYLTTFLVLLMIPLGAVGAWAAYNQTRSRIREFNDVTPLRDTDIEKALRLVAGVDDADSLPTPQAEAFAVSLAVPTIPPMNFESDNGAEDNGENPANLDNPPDEVTLSLDTNGDGAPDTPADISLPPQIDPRRKTVLMMGIDQREGEEGPFRTDTMIVMSFDPIGRTGVLLSIPRDLWVSIPGTNRQARINSANFIGDDPDLNFPGGGPALAVLTVERLLGIPIDHYVLVNFDAFTTLIDVLGAVEVCPTERIFDDKYPDGSYGYITVEFEAGCQALEGERLLQYARTRATEGGDFDRASRQQEVVLAVRKHIMSAGGVSALLGDAFNIWEAVSANVRTDLSLDEMIELALAAAEVQDVRNATIGTGEVFPGTAEDGSQVLIPIQSDILALVSNLFRPPQRPAVSAEDGLGGIEIDPNNLPLVIRQEAPIIVLLNGTLMQGRAGNLRDFVMSYSLDVGVVGNAATTDHVESYIIYYGDHAESARYLSAILATINGNNLLRIEQREGRDERGNVIVVIGTDLAIPQSVE